MKISTKLRLNSIVVTSMVVVFIGMAALFVFKLQQAQQKQQLAQKITETSFQLALLRSEYKEHPSERPKNQWIHIYETQARLLDEAAPLFTTGEEKALFDDTREVSADARKLFGDLVVSTEQGGSEIIVGELNNQLAIKAQVRVSNVLRLSELAREQATSVGYQFGFATVIFGILIVTISIGSHVISRSIAGAFRTLGEGTKIIAGGDLNHRLQLKAHDEIGELAQLFNTMADKLKESQETLEKKIHDRTQDLHKFSQAVESATDGVLITDPKGIIIYVNRAWEQLTGYTDTEVIGKNPRFLQSGKTKKEVFATMWQTISQGKPFRTEEVINKRKNGSEYAAQFHVFPIREEGQNLFYVELSQDISKRKEIDQLKTDFISMASHQLLTPVAIIQGYISLLIAGKGGTLSAPATSFLYEVTLSVKRIENLIRKFLTTSKVETGSIKVNWSTFELTHRISEMVHQFKSEARKKQLQLTVAPAKKILIYADLEQVTEILSNLIGNALKYTEKGGVTISVEERETMASVTIMDTGIGIPDADLPHIFEKFYWSKNWVEKQNESNSLGLYIVKLLVLSMGGTIEVVSHIGKGSRFTFTLPLAKE